MTINYLLENELLEYFEKLRVSFLVEEKNIEIKALFLDML
jgi:hypothetical protein